MLIRKNRSSLLLLVYILFGVYCFVFGDNGILERMRFVEHKKEIKNNTGKLIQENNNLQKEYSIIRSSQTNGNFYKEEASKSGFISSGEKYIFFKGGEKNKTNIEAITKEDNYPVEMSHLRIFWIAVSSMLILFYFWKRNRENKENENIDATF